MSLPVKLTDLPFPSASCGRSSTSLFVPVICKHEWDYSTCVHADVGPPATFVLNAAVIGLFMEGTH